MGATWEVARFALLSRAVVSSAAALAAMVVPAYDTSSHFAVPVRALRAFVNWDAVHFLHLADRGYEYEHVHAFFPLYPLLVRIFSAWLPSGSNVALVMAGWLVSNGAFVLAAVCLYRLGLLVLHDERVACRAAYLFAVTPSGIFMSALYSESLMCLCSFAGMLFLEEHKRGGSILWLVLCAMAFGASSGTRSNGILLSLFIAWHRLRASPNPVATPLRFLGYWIFTALLGIIAVIPQVWYFVQAMPDYCPNKLDFVRNKTASQITIDRPWCEHVFPNFSAMYMFIQAEYWGVGPFKYYTINQLPNFLLASPIILLSAHSLWSYFSPRLRRHKAMGSSAAAEANSFVRSSAAAPYCLHWLFLLANALVVVHIQVTTRFLAACPPLYWAPAALIGTKLSSATHSTYTRTVVAYFVVFNVLGVSLFSTFYPWT
ncbi:TPA: hypothetical protein N0F65_011901 [Lagenidium giganteum]|uniref:GPI mannosyltransferase 2 n=1 Tax=Lagenidium giganteum TaxID=4803 RepID=A0AAV2YLR4_9STRA|nr:TPA: hypothetical protein N0F65_011901 [Lagenidium giganteum]